MAKIDIDNISKQMPYSVPEGFFDKLENDILVKVKAQREAAAKTTLKPSRNRTKMFKIGWSAIAVAASIAMGFIVHHAITPKTTDPLNMDYQMAFELLSNNDKEELVYIYQNDIFLQ